MHRAVMVAAVVMLHAALGAPPVVQSLFPIGGQRGTEVVAQVSGTLDPWPLAAWADHPGIRISPDPMKKGFYKIGLAPDTPPGPHLLRFHNAHGASSPRVFLVGTAPDLPEVEPNDAFGAAQSVTNLPVVIHGKLEKNGDVDSYKIGLKAGQTLVAAVDAFTAGSPMDALLTLRDERGSRVAFNHDAHSLDPRLIWPCRREGVYLLQIAAFAHPASSSVGFSGGAAHVYRLTVTQGPYVSHALPMGVTRGQPAKVELRGWNLAPATFLDVAPTGGDEVLLGSAAVNAPLRLPARAGAHGVETEPNDAALPAQAFTPPGSVTGCISHDGDVDRVAFRAVRGQGLFLDLRSGREGFLLDGRLAIEDGNGTVLASDDDSGGRKDPQLNWTAPADGVYFAVVTDLFNHGGPEHVYRLGIAGPEPDFSATVAAPNYVVEPGRTNDVKVTVRMSGGFGGKLWLAAAGLPAGVSALPVDISKAGEATLKLVAAVGAAPASGEWRMELRQAEGNQTRRATCELTSSSVDNGVPQGFPDLVIRQTDRLWISLTPPAPAPTAPPAKTP